MPKINVNLTEVTGDFEVYPDIDFLVEILDSSKVVQSKEGNNMIRWIGEILDPPEYVGKKYSWQTSLVPAALWNLKNMMEAIGVPYDEDGFELEEVFGRQIIVTNEVREYQGQDRNNVKGYKPAFAVAKDDSPF